VERFEPHGFSFDLGREPEFEDRLNACLRDFWEDKVSPLLQRPIHYKTPLQTCPRIKTGLQVIEGRIPNHEREVEGYCMLWSVFVLEMMLMNPTRSTQHVLQRVHALSENNPAYLRAMMRGYTQELEDFIRADGNMEFSFVNANAEFVTPEVQLRTLEQMIGSMNPGMDERIRRQSQITHPLPTKRAPPPPVRTYNLRK
jgi:hypothetical protein